MSAAVLEAVDTVVCPTPLKRVYSAYRSALCASRAMREIFPDTRLFAYGCQCGQFHLSTWGHKKKTGVLS